MRGRITLLASILALCSNGCRHARKFVLPPAPLAAVAKPLPEARIETPPEIETAMPMVEIPMPEVKVEPPPRPSDRRRPQSAQTPSAPTSPEAQPAAPVPVVPATPAPRLGEILTDQRRRAYEAELNGFVTEARAAVNRASGRRLTPAQRQSVARIREFLQQAEASRVNDLPTALQLARRADLLGQDLVKSLR